MPRDRHSRQLASMSVISFACGCIRPLVAVQIKDDSRKNEKRWWSDRYV